jgi:Tol biopolymer transport system component
MQALSASWAPNSNVIAINEIGPISLIHSDGTGLTVLTTNTYEPELAWSPDGNWIAARNATSGKIDLLSVATPGLVLTLPYTGGIGSPTWH